MGFSRNYRRPLPEVTCEATTTLFETFRRPLMIRVATALFIAASIAALATQEAAAKGHKPCQTCGEEIPQFTGTGGGLEAWFLSPPAVDANRASPRRRAHFYSWQGNCYALDRSRQWRWIDPAFC
jgi:hypothetical protein